MTIRACLTWISLTLALSAFAGCGTEPAATPANDGAAAESASATETPAAAENDEIAQAIAELPPAEQAAALAQKWCPVSAMNGGDNLLGSMGKPFKVTIDGEDVFLCCESCVEEAQEDPAATLAKVEELTRMATEGAQ